MRELPNWRHGKRQPANNERQTVQLDSPHPSNSTVRSRHCLVRFFLRGSFPLEQCVPIRALPGVMLAFLRSPRASAFFALIGAALLHLHSFRAVLFVRCCFLPLLLGGAAFPSWFGVVLLFPLGWCCTSPTFLWCCFPLKFFLLTFGRIVKRFWWWSESPSKVPTRWIGGRSRGCRCGF